MRFKAPHGRSTHGTGQGRSLIPTSATRPSGGPTHTHRTSSGNSPRFQWPFSDKYVAILDTIDTSYIFLVYVTVDFEKITGFDWDDGNVAKNEVHGVSYLECEEVFFGDPLYITPDESHSGAEQRFRVLGQTRNGRLLAVIITLRKQNTLIRVISARDMHRKERKLYEEGT